MRDGIVLGEQRALRGESVEVWCSGIPDHLAELAILEDQEEHTTQGRDLARCQGCSRRVARDRRRRLWRRAWRRHGRGGGRPAGRRGPRRRGWGGGGAAPEA